MMYTTVEHHLDSTDWIAAPPPPKHYQSESQDKGVKYDQGKPKMDLIPPNALLAVGAVFEFGAKKYAVLITLQPSEQCLGTTVMQPMLLCSIEMIDRVS